MPWVVGRFLQGSFTSERDYSYNYRECCREREREREVAGVRERKYMTPFLGACEYSSMTRYHSGTCTIPFRHVHITESYLSKGREPLAKSPVNLKP